MRKATWLLFVSLLCLATACSEQTGAGYDATKDSAASSSANTTAAPDADNTSRNADTSALSQTPTAQSESETDIKISAAIRKAVVDDSALSVNAHNVKIVTDAGVVTLRGPVKSDREKESIESKAKQVAGVTRVNNLLEVEKNP